MEKLDQHQDKIISLASLCTRREGHVVSNVGTAVCSMLRQWQSNGCDDSETALVCSEDLLRYRRFYEMSAIVRH